MVLAAGDGGNFQTGLNLLDTGHEITVEVVS